MSRNITHIFIHCSAGFGDHAAMQRHWRSLGWRNEGYHRIVYTNGMIIKAVEFSRVTNGVANWNSRSIHICYQGGVNRQNVNQALDTRTLEQNAGLITCINEALDWCRTFMPASAVAKIKILGHRDISPDKNLNGRIDPWERIKECPSFEVADWLKSVKNQIRLTA